MASRTGITTPIQNRLEDDHQSLFLAVKAEFDTGDVLVWSGTEDMVISSETYTGAGTFLNISGVEEGREVKQVRLCDVEDCGMGIEELDVYPQDEQDEADN